MSARAESEYNMEPTEAFQPRLRALAKGNTVREITAPRGSVIFFHGRLAHSAGENRLPGTVRMAAFCDFQKEQEILDVPPVDGSSFRRVAEVEGWVPSDAEPHPRTQFWVDTRERVEERRPPPADMWADWAPLPR